MAKGQMRSNREAKKPKKKKAETVLTSSAFSSPPTKTGLIQYTKRQK